MPEWQQTNAKRSYVYRRVNEVGAKRKDIKSDRKANKQTENK